MIELKENLYKYDTKLREKLLPIRPEYISNPFSIYEIDLVASDPDRRNKNSSNYLKPVELQVCTKWDLNYPFNTIYIFERKKKHLYSDCYIWVFNRSFTMYYQLDTTTLYPGDYKIFHQKFNKYVYAIPKHLWTLHWIDGSSNSLNL